jgi:hypothetical protein
MSDRGRWDEQADEILDGECFNHFFSGKAFEVISAALREAYEEGRREERESCAKAVCEFCRAGYPLINGCHKFENHGAPYDAPCPGQVIRARGATDPSHPEDGDGSRRSRVQDAEGRRGSESEEQRSADGA